MIRWTLALAALLTLSFAAQSVSGQTQGGRRTDGPGAVFTMSNAPEGNQVLAFHRAASGMLTPAGSHSTGGLGSGDGLGNQGALALNTEDRWLFVVNAGSNDLSVFELGARGLELASVTDTMGLRPISVTVHDDVVYVLNAGGAVGGSDSIAGFRLDPHGGLSFLEGSVQPLSAESTAPAQIAFSPDGQHLVVTEKSTATIDLYPVTRDGLAGAPVSYASSAATPFGFAFGKRSQVFVSEAAGGAPGASSVSSYRISRGGELELISAAVPTTETAACWLVVSNDGRFAYTTNGGSASVSGFAIEFDGEISLLDPDGRTGDTGQTPLDMALSRDGRNLYTLDVGDGQLSAFRVQADGSLIPLRSQGGLPPGVNGLAAR